MYKSKGTAFNGIWQWVQCYNYRLIKDKPITKEISNLTKLIKSFLIENNIEHRKSVNDNFNNVQVQKNFSKFKEWILNK